MRHVDRIATCATVALFVLSSAGSVSGQSPCNGQLFGGRTFDLNLENRTAAPIRFTVVYDRCCDSPRTGQEFGPVQPGERACLWIARVQGNGCDGENGNFAIVPSGFEERQFFSFDNAGWLGLNGLAGSYDGTLSAKSPVDGSYTYTLREAAPRLEICNSPEPDGLGARTFNLWLENDTTDVVSFRVTENGCTDSPQAGQFYGPLAPGGRVCVWIARVQGNGCDGEQGTFAIEPTTHPGDRQHFSFSNDGWIAPVSVPQTYNAAMSGRNPADGSFTWTMTEGDGGFVSCNSREPDSLGPRTFNLWIKNDTAATVSFEVMGHGCADSPQTGQVYGPLPPGGRTCVWIARVQGNGCDGENGSFLIEPSTHRGDRQSFSFDNEGGLGVTNAPESYASGLSVKHPVDGSFTWTMYEVETIESFYNEVDKDPQLKRDLLVQYAPRVHMHPDEEYFPSSVEFFFEHVQRVGTGTASYYNTLEGLSDPGDSEVFVFYGHDGTSGRPALATAPVYAYWARKGPFVDLVYYVFYAYNRGKETVEIVDTVWGNHVGDWEHIYVRLEPVFDAGEPTFEPKIVHLSAHSDVDIDYPFESFPKVDGTQHPVVYEAWGSHGMWASPGRFVYREIDLGLTSIELVDYTAAGVAWDSWNKLEAMDVLRQESLRSGEPWPAWMGSDYDQPGGVGLPTHRWGNREEDCWVIPVVDERVCRLENGPTGPQDKAVLRAYKSSGEDTEDCNDGRDNDRDGAIDADDADCHPPVHEENLVEDGGFELGLTAGPSTYIDRRPSFGAWTAVVNPALLGMPYNGVPAYEGSETMHIGHARASAGVEQSFATTIGAEYRLTFALIGWAGGGVTATVEVSGADGSDLRADFAAPGENRWVQHTATFTASAARTTLQLRNRSGASTIDDVRVVPTGIVESGGELLRGDCNHDGRVNISDASCTLNWLFLGAGEPPCRAAANANGDSRVDISDASYLLNFLFLGGPGPAAPYPECGAATLASDEALGCEESACP